MKRFKVGELARFVVPIWPGQISHVGEVVEIIQLDPPPGMHGKRDYLCRWHEKEGQLLDYQLAKLDPPEETDSLTRREECEA